MMSITPEDFQKELKNLSAGELKEIVEELDGMEPVNVLETIADYLELTPLQVLESKLGRELVHSTQSDDTGGYYIFHEIFTREISEWNEELI